MIVNFKPPKVDLVFSESRAYCEQVGWNLQWLPTRGEMNSRYPFTREMNSFFKSSSTGLRTATTVKPLYSNALTTFFSASAQHRSSSHRWHARPKPVFVFSFSIAWLICSFHFISKRARETTNLDGVSQKNKNRENEKYYSVKTWNYIPKQP